MTTHQNNTSKMTKHMIIVLLEFLGCIVLCLGFLLLVLGMIVGIITEYHKLPGYFTHLNGWSYLKVFLSSVVFGGMSILLICIWVEESAKRARKYS